MQPGAQRARAHGVERIRCARALREEFGQRQQVHCRFHIVAHAQRHGRALPERFRCERVGGKVARKGAQDAARTGLIPLRCQRRGFVEPRLAKAITRGKFVDDPIKQRDGRGRIFGAKIGLGQSQQRRRIARVSGIGALEEGGVGVDRRTIGGGQEINVAALHQVKVHIAIDEFHQRKIGGLRRRRRCSGGAPLLDGGGVIACIGEGRTRLVLNAGAVGAVLCKVKDGQERVGGVGGAACVVEQLRLALKQTRPGRWIGRGVGRALQGVGGGIDIAYRHVGIGNARLHILIHPGIALEKAPVRLDSGVVRAGGSQRSGPQEGVAPEEIGSAGGLRGGIQLIQGGKRVGGRTVGQGCTRQFKARLKRQRWLQPAARQQLVKRGQRSRVIAHTVELPPLVEQKGGVGDGGIRRSGGGRRHSCGHGHSRRRATGRLCGHTAGQRGFHRYGGGITLCADAIGCKWRGRKGGHYLGSSCLSAAIAAGQQQHQQHKCGR